MYIEEFFIMMFLGVFVHLVIIGANFANFVGILLKIFPLRTPRGYGETKEIRDNIMFKEHKKKWILIYLLLVLFFVISYAIIAMFTNSYGYAFLIAIIISVFYFGITGNFETKQRKVIEQQIKKSLLDSL